MFTQDPKQQAIFPSLPTIPILDSNGNMNYDWQLFFQTLVMALQTNIKPEGIVVPQQSTSNISLLTADESIANIIYDSTTDNFKGNIAGTWKTFTLT
jgi:hypothetical protein